MSWKIHVWHALSTSLYGDWGTRCLFFFKNFIHYCVNLLFALYLMRQSLFRDVVILYHRSTGTSLLISFRISAMFVMFWYWSVLLFFFFSMTWFQMFIYSNFYVASMRMSHLSRDFMFRGSKTMVSPSEWSHLTECQLNNFFSPAKVRQVQRTCKCRSTKQTSQLSRISLIGSIL